MASRPAGIRPAASLTSDGIGARRPPGRLFTAADLVSATLKEITEIEWPVCAVHGGHPASIWDGQDPVGLIDRVAWWQCTNTGHALAPVGHLTAGIAKTQ